MELLDLDEDSLLEIFSYFSFDELLLLSEVNRRFLQLSDRHLRKIRHFELDYRAIAYCESYELRLQRIFPRLGPTMESFRFSGGYIMGDWLKHIIVHNLTTYCTSLRHLTINFMILTEQHLKPLAVLLRTLVSLNLGHCNLTDAGLDRLLRSRPLQLRFLAIPGNTFLTGTFFEHWVDCTLLEQLDVSHCFSITVENMEHFLRHAKRLMAVNVTGSIRLQGNEEIFHKEGRFIALRTKMPTLKYFKSG